MPGAATPGTALNAGGASSLGLPPGLSLPRVLTPGISSERPALSAPQSIARPSAILAAAAERIGIAEKESSGKKSRGSAARLKKISKSAATAAEEGSRAEKAACSSSALFDGIAAEDAEAVAAYFSRGSRAPALPQVEKAALSLFRAMMPELYRPVPFTARYDEGARPQTGHLWSEETGHIIEIAPGEPDSKDEVASAFGVPGLTRVQEKVEQLLEFAHEYAHVIFDEAVGKAVNHHILSAYSAMTEGFAVALEQLIIERTLKAPERLGLSERDAKDLTAVAAARWHWLANEDNHYAEGILSWRTAFKQGGIAGIQAFLSSLSSARMIETPRADPAYQLAAGDPDLLSAYLGNDAADPLRRGLMMFSRLAKGEDLADDAGEAEAAVEAAGPEGRRRVFIRSLIDGRRIPGPGSSRGRGSDEKSQTPASVRAAFALARISPAGAAELAAYLVRLVQTSEGARRLFGRPGPSEKLNAIIEGAQSLPFTPAQHEIWDQALNTWLLAV